MAQNEETAQIIELIFDGEMKTCTVETDRNGEFVCTSPAGEFVKFPKNSNISKEAAKHNTVNAPAE